LGPIVNIRRPEKALTARFIETVSKPGKYFDGQGLFLRVQPNGSRQWVQRITIRVELPPFNRTVRRVGGRA
jgi:hypothetical protein